MKHFPSRLRLLIGLCVVGVSFGYIEAAVVVYLRGYYEPLHQRLYPERAAGDLLPLIPLEAWPEFGVAGCNWQAVELYREVATLVLLVGVAIMVGRGFHHGLAAFVFVFGLWDVWYYVFLWLLIDWPSSLMTWDILFLVPIPWVAPVLAPSLVALTMVIGGATVLWGEDQPGAQATGQPRCDPSLALGAGKDSHCLSTAFRPRVADWCLMIAGGGIIWLSFCWEYADIQAGHYPQTYPWPVFAVGLGLAVVGWVRAWHSGPMRSMPAMRPARQIAFFTVR